LCFNGNMQGDYSDFSLLSLPKASGRLTLLFLFAALILGSRLPPVMDDPDLWWHLATGRWILEEARLPSADPFSHTAWGLPWLAYSWLPDLLFVSLERTFGLVAFPWMVAIVCLATHLSVFGIAWTRTRRFVPSLVTALLCFTATFPYWNERPQIFSFLLLTALVWGLERVDKGAKMPFVWIPLVFVFWSNIHIYFPLGWFVLGVGCVWRLFKPGRRQTAPWIVLFSSSVLATLLTPYHIRLHSYLATLLLRWNSVTISEEMGPLWSRPDVTVAVVFFSLVFLLTVPRTHHRLKAFSLFLPLLFLSLTQLKLVPFLVLGTCGALAEGLSETSLFKHRLTLQIDNGDSPQRNFIRSLCCLAALGWVVLRAPRETSIHLALKRTGLPQKACQTLAYDLPTGILFNPIDEGGYLIYRLYPRWRVFVDPRNHLYALLDNFHQQYLQCENAPFEGASAWVDRFGVDTALVRRGTCWHSVFAQNEDWTVVHEDTTHLVLRRTR